MKPLLDIGYGYFISADRIVWIAPPDANPIKTLLKDKKQLGLLRDLSAGRGRRSVVGLDTREVVITAKATKTLSKQWKKLRRTKIDLEEEV